MVTVISPFLFYIFNAYNFLLQTLKIMLNRMRTPSAFCQRKSQRTEVCGQRERRQIKIHAENTGINTRRNLRKGRAWLVLSFQIYISNFVEISLIR